MKNNVNPNDGHNGHTLQSGSYDINDDSGTYLNNYNGDKNRSEEEGYVDDTDFGSEVVKRNPNLVDTGSDDNSDDNFDNDLDDDEDNE
jgi:hypothetical protein